MGTDGNILLSGDGRPYTCFVDKLSSPHLINLQDGMPKSQQKLSKAGLFVKASIIFYVNNGTNEHHINKAID